MAKQNKINLKSISINARGSYFMSVCGLYGSIGIPANVGAAIVEAAVEAGLVAERKSGVWESFEFQAGNALGELLEDEQKGRLFARGEFQRLPPLERKRPRNIQGRYKSGK